jgi:ribose transport system substrate-binding protein
MAQSYGLYSPRALRRRGAGALIAAALGVGLLVGCGSSSDNSDTSSSSTPAAASTTASDSTASTTSSDAALQPVLDNLAAAQAVPKFTPPGPAFDASPAKGKKVFFLSVLLTVPAQQYEWQGTQAAAEAAGLTAVSYDAKGTTDGAVQGIQQAIAQKADALIIDAVPSATIAAQIKKAQDAGIEVIITQERNEATGGPKIDTGNGTVAFDFIGAAKLEADWVLADSGGKDLNVVTFSVPGDPAHGDMVDTINAELKKYAQGDVKITNERVLGADWATRLPTLVRSLLTKDPSINYMIPVVDGQALYIVPALHQIGNKDVKIAGFNGTPAVMSMIQKGEVEGADIGSSFVWQGWANMDQALRALTGQAPAKNEGAALRLFDESNIADINVKAPEQGAEWYDTDAAIAGYKQLWGVS